MNSTKKVAVTIFFISLVSVFMYGASKPVETPKQQDVSFEVRGNSEVCEKDYDKCAANCEIKSKTEKAFDACMESCELKYDECYNKEQSKPKK